MDIDLTRRAFAEELRYVAHVKSNPVIEAFATVRREDFLGPTPWKIAGDDGYWEVSDPSAACHNVLIAIDAERELNNGQPEFWARLLDRMEIRAGDKICHIGAGTGYYTAIMAELAGPDGAVIAVEIDAGLAERARSNLASFANVQVVCADGAVFDPGAVDVVIVNAGASQIMPAWLSALLPAGRLLVPLTSETGRGSVFRIERLALGKYAARVISGVGIYACSGARTPESARALERVLAGGGQRFVRSLRCDAHERGATCWLHGSDFCLSTDAVETPVAEN